MACNLLLVLTWLLVLGSAVLYPVKATMLRVANPQNLDVHVSGSTLVLPPPQQDAFHFNMTSDLPSPSHKFMRIPVPANCVSSSSGDKSECPSSQMTAFNVSYEDCGSQWTVCRCSNANMTLATSLDRLGRIPVGLRRYIHTVAVLSDAAPHAYTISTGDVHMFGNITDQEAWIHEATHAFDFSVRDTISGSRAWEHAIRKDTCIPDVYAATDPMENFAQVSVIKIYSLLHGGLLPAGFSRDCMKHQLDFLDTLPMYDPKTLFGKTCAISSGTKYGRPPHIDPPTQPATSTFTIPAASRTAADFTSTAYATRSFSLQRVRAGQPTSTAAPVSNNSKKTENNAASSHGFSNGGLSGTALTTTVLAVMVVWICW